MLCVLVMKLKDPPDVVFPKDGPLYLDLEQLVLASLAQRASSNAICLYQ